VLRWFVFRVLTAVITLLGVSVIVFGAIHLVPGRYEDILLGPFGTPELKAAIAERYGLDGPLPEQYVRWLAAAVTGDFGTSLATHQPVLAEFARRAPVTAQLALMATGLALLVGLPLGILSAVGATRRGVRAGSRLASALGLSFPDFVLGSLLVFVFSRYQLGPTVGGFVPLAQDPLQNLRAMILPAVTLSIFGMALIARTCRDAVLNVMTEPYVTAAVARGESRWDIVRRHVLRNASIPVVTVVATYIAYLLGGAVIVEKLFTLPGFGIYVLTAVGNRDYAIVQAGVLIAAAVFIGINILSDILYAVLDPRISAARRAT
jgi:peptide/nickel transport system permease protein